MFSSMVHTGLLACSLGVDAFAASCGMGAGRRENRVVLGLRLGGICGFFQFLMPLLGWFLGLRFAPYVEAWDHWIAFGLLAFVGGHMILEAYKKDPEKSSKGISWGLLLSIGIATAIDAFAVGAGMAFINHPILPLAVTAGIFAALVSFAGVLLGHHAGCVLGPPMERAGGLVLILLGCNILRIHLF